MNQTDKKENGSYPIFKHKVTEPSILAMKEGNYLYTVPILLQKCKQIKIVCIVRNPFDVMESWINAPAEFKPEWDILEEWGFAASKNQYRPENYFGYYKWKECIKLNVDMQKRYPNNFITLRYEDLKNDALNESRSLFTFLDMPFTKQTEDFIESSQSKTVDGVYSVYLKKNEVRKRQFYLPNEVKEKISHDLRNFKEAKILGY